jgi:hypothetical protein
MNSWQLNKKVDCLSDKLQDPEKSETRIDFNCLSQPERTLLDKVQEIVDEYAPASPPKDVIDKNSALWYKGLEIFGKRVTELFVEVVPGSFCCDELEAWYFKLYFYNFMLDWTESIQKLRKMPTKQREALLAERKEMGLLNMVFRLPRSQPKTEKQNKPRRHPK